MTVTLVLKKGFDPRNIYMYAKYESSITYHLKAMTNIKKFLPKNGQTKNYMPPIYRCGNMKKKKKMENKTKNIL